MQSSTSTITSSNAFFGPKYLKCCFEINLIHFPGLFLALFCGLTTCAASLFNSYSTLTLIKLCHDRWLAVLDHDNG